MCSDNNPGEGNTSTAWIPLRELRIREPEARRPNSVFNKNCYCCDCMTDQTQNYTTTTFHGRSDDQVINTYANLR